MAQCIAFGLVLFTALNGLDHYLKRIGIIHPDRYQTYIAVHKAGCGDGYFNFRSPEQYRIEKPYFQYLYQSEGGWRLLKTGKYVFVFTIILYLTLSWILSPPQPAGAIKTQLYKKDEMFFLVVSAFFLLVLMLTIVSCIRYASVQPIFGLWFFSFLFIGLLGAEFATNHFMAVIADGLAILLLLQLLLTPFELFFGMPIHDHLLGYTGLAGRAAGTIIMPNTLGILTVIILVFYDAFSANPTTHYRWVLFIAAGLVVFFSGSGTGFACLAVIVGKWAMPLIAGSKWRITVFISVLFLSTAALMPLASSRLDVYDSIRGRLREFGHQLISYSPRELLIGKAMGSGTNLAFLQAQKGIAENRLPITSAESMPAALLAQTGFTGIILFYGMLIFIFIKASRIRLLILVFFLTSLTAKITEIFPVCVVMGLVLANALSHSADHLDHENAVA